MGKLAKTGLYLGEILRSTSSLNCHVTHAQGGFQAEMTKREAALILGLRESAAEERVKDAHRRIMIANHPDAGGSSYIAAKVNEAKDMMLGKSRKAGSAF